MSFGIYLHFPFCLQQCPYCDFATLPNDNSLHGNYMDSILKEFALRAQFFGPRKLDSIYLGGGTPSLLEPKYILELVNSFEKHGFSLSDLKEFSIEINPGTLDSEKLKTYLDIGINRFSLGAQSFQDPLLKSIGRKHTSKDTIHSIQLLTEKDLNYSFDLLFSLPHQDLQNLEDDLNKISHFLPPHVSVYYLTIPKSNKLNIGRPIEEMEMQMFDTIESKLLNSQYERYEISNYCQKGSKSIHNWNTWRGGEYWGLGLSAHSFVKEGDFGARFWNPSSLSAYQKYGAQEFSSKESFIGQLAPKYGELLTEKDLLNDKVHTNLRTQLGLIHEELEQNFSRPLLETLYPKIQNMQKEGFLLQTPLGYSTSTKGRKLFNLVLEKLFI